MREMLLRPLDGRPTRPPTCYTIGSRDAGIARSNGVGESNKRRSRAKWLVPVILSVWLPVTMIGSPAWAQSCGDLAGESDVVTCATPELQQKADALQRAYDALAEALGPRAAAGLPDDQAQWLARVTKHCGTTAASSGDLESIMAGKPDTAQTLCLARFVEARVRDLVARQHQAGELVARFAHAEYPAVGSTVGDRINSGGMPPLGRFAAHYLRSGEPATLVATDTVDAVAINYAWNEFHGIKSEDFEGYWVGRFKYNKETPVYIAVDQSWSRTRVIVDRKLVYDGGGNARVPFVFSRGIHKVEVEFANNWHTTSLSVTLAEAVTYVRRTELRSRLESLVPKNAVVQFAAVYESGAVDNSVALNLEPTELPVILVLSSVRAVRWKVENPHAVDIRAIVHGSSAPGNSILIADRGETVPRLPTAEALGPYDAKPRCNCVGGMFTCDGGSLATTVQSLSALLGFPVAGFTGAYSPVTLNVPGVVITPMVMSDARAELEKVGRERGECRKTNRIGQ